MILNDIIFPTWLMMKIFGILILNFLFLKKTITTVKLLIIPKEAMVEESIIMTSIFASFELVCVSRVTFSLDILKLLVHFHLLTKEEEVVTNTAAL